MPIEFDLQSGRRTLWDGQDSHPSHPSRAGSGRDSVDSQLNVSGSSVLEPRRRFNSRAVPKKKRLSSTQSLPTALQRISHRKDAETYDSPPGSPGGSGAASKGEPSDKNVANEYITNLQQQVYFLELVRIHGRKGQQGRRMREGGGTGRGVVMCV